MNEKIIYRLWRKYLAAVRANTVTEWKKYLLSCLRANVFPPLARNLDFMCFVESIRDNVFETVIEQEENENEHFVRSIHDNVFETVIEQEEIENEHE